MSSSAYNLLHEKGHGGATGKTKALRGQRGHEKDALFLGTETAGIAGQAKRGHSTLEHEAEESAGAVAPTITGDAILVPFLLPKKQQVPPLRRSSLSR